MKKSWFEIENRANNSAKISIVGDIGSGGITASAFKSALEDLSGVENLDMDFYSSGGNMYDGLFMFDVLSSHPAHKTGRVVNIAASAATLPLMAMDVINMPSNSKIMIHQPMASIHAANSGVLRKVAGLMDDMQSVAVEIYQHKTKLSRDVLSEMVNSETYLTAEQAKNLGFADIVTSPFNIKNQANSLIEIKNIRDLEQHLRDSGYTKKQAMEIIASCKLSDSVADLDYTPISAKLNALTIPKSIL
jgi:ATP-dependent Clp protease, protease subunit